MELQVNETQGEGHYIFGFDKKDENRVVVAIAIAVFSRARVAPLAGYVGNYKSELTPSLAKELIDESNFDNYVFFFDYLFGKNVGIGIIRKQEGSLILVDRENKPIPIKKAKMIIEEANYQLCFEDE